MSWSRRFHAAEYLRLSLWVVPVLFAFAGPLLGRASVALERRTHLQPVMAFSEGTATQLLGSIIGAMLSLIGLVITLLPLIAQLASAQLAPAVIHLWYQDRRLKVTLAVFLGTLTYSFSLLSRVRAGFVPSNSISLAAFFVLISLIAFLAYINRFAHRLSPVAVADLVSLTGAKAIEKLYPERYRPGVGDARQARPGGARTQVVVNTGAGGVLQAIDEAGLVAKARQVSGTLVLVSGVGDFVNRGAPLMELVDAQRRLRDEALWGCVALGSQRRLEQDPGFALRILVDIALKALSPAVNDPTTGVHMIDRIEDLLTMLGRRDLHGWNVYDEDGQLRLIVPSRSWADYLTLGVSEIRLNGATSPQVCRRLRALLEMLEESVPAERRPVVAAELENLESTVQHSFSLPVDRVYASRGDTQGIGIDKESSGPLH